MHTKDYNGRYYTFLQDTYILPCFSKPMWNFPGITQVNTLTQPPLYQVK